MKKNYITPATETIEKLMPATHLMGVSFSDTPAITEDGPLVKEELDIWEE